jgi:hypothetical protein
MLLDDNSRLETEHDIKKKSSYKKGHSMTNFYLYNRKNKYSRAEKKD